MPSGKSFFNITVYKKTLLRCWPIAVIYTGLWLAILPMNLLNGLERGLHLWVQRQVLESATVAGAFLAFFASAAVAMAVFGWMYNTRSTGFTAALPVSRTALYLTSLSAGFTVLLGSCLLVFVCTAAAESLYGGLDMAALWQWLGWVFLLHVHFFGFAACCAMLTGHLLVLPAVYAIFQLAVVVIQGTVYYILEHIVWGLDYGSWSLGFLSPIWTLPSIYPSGITDPLTGATVEYYLEYWPVVLAYAGAGVLLAVLGWWLFRRRRMEAATDVVAIPVLKPVFRWCLAFAGSLGFGGLLVTVVYAPRSGGGNLSDALTVLLAMVLGGLAGWFLADMLMRKTVRVLRLHWKGALLYTALIALFVTGAELDLIGYEDRLPDREEVHSVYVSCPDGFVQLTGPENIDLAMALHESVAQNRALHEQETPAEGWYMNLYLSYNGPEDGEGHAPTLLTRRYELLVTDELAADPDSDIMQLERLMNTQESIALRKATRLPVIPENIYQAAVYEEYAYDEEPFHLELTAEEAYELYTECILPDLADGTLGRLWLVTDEDYENTVYNLYISIGLSTPRPDWLTEDPRKYGTVPADREAPPRLEQAALLNEIPHEYDGFYTVPTVDSRRTNAWLKAHGVPMETLGQVWNAGA